MGSSIFIPERIKVGYCPKKDTYSDKLGYVIYYDAAGVLRKEKSWESWRDKTIESDEYDNVPVEGFVLNKKVGGHNTGWNHRQTYARVFDPRGFEIEITVPNLLYILENTSCVKGKGLEGEFVYAWDGTELVLMPVSAPEYGSHLEWSLTLKNKVSVKSKDLILGATYLTKQNTSLIYLGRFCEWEHSYREHIPDKNTGKKYWFIASPDDRCFKTYTGLNHLVKVLDPTCHEDYVDIIDRMESKREFSPLDPAKDIYVDMDFECLKTLTAYSSSETLWFEYRGKNWTTSVDRPGWNNPNQLYRFEKARNMSYQPMPRAYWESDPEADEINNLLLSGRRSDENCIHTYEDVVRLITQFGMKIRKRFLVNGKEAN